LVNSRLELFTATHLLSGHPFSRSYGAILLSLPCGIAIALDV
jgi:hypothetical protein